jgi:chromosome partitioning protein
MTLVIATVNLKGGTGKTTSTAFMAEAFVELGRSVLIVDADPQGSAVRWSERAGWSVPTLELPAANLHRQLPGIIGNRYDVVLIDTPPTPKHRKGQVRSDQAGIVESALRIADLVLIPLAPTLMELERFPEVLAAIETAAASRRSPQVVRALLNRTTWNASSTDVVRQTLLGAGIQVLTTEIPRREVLAQSFGGAVKGNLHGYFSAAKELEAAL